MAFDLNNLVSRYHLVQAKKLAEANGYIGALTIAQWEEYLKMKGFID